MFWACPISSVLPIDVALDIDVEHFPLLLELELFSSSNGFYSRLVTRRELIRTIRCRTRTSFFSFATLFISIVLNRNQLPTEEKIDRFFVFSFIGTTDVNGPSASLNDKKG